MLSSSLQCIYKPSAGTCEMDFEAECSCGAIYAVTRLPSAVPVTEQIRCLECGKRLDRWTDSKVRYLYVRRALSAFARSADSKGTT
jgi:hypothetical protein